MSPRRHRSRSRASASGGTTPAASRAPVCMVSVSALRRTLPSPPQIRLSPGRECYPELPGSIRDAEEAAGGDAVQDRLGALLHLTGLGVRLLAGAAAELLEDDPDAAGPCTPGWRPRAGGGFAR